MRSLRVKIVLLVLLGCVLSATVVGILSIQNTKTQIQKDSTTLMNKTTLNSGQEIDAVISRIEQSVETMADCVLNNLTDLNKFKSNDNYVQTFTQSMKNTLLSVAEHTEGAITAYIRFSPDFTEPTSGLFLSRDSTEDSFNSLTPTDFSTYDQSDAAHVGWYYIPVNNKKATWMSPYLNENLQVYMVSFVVPIFKNDVSVGVVGMDIDFRLIQDIVDNTKIYETGYAFLLDEKERIIHHKSLPLNEKLEDVNSDQEMDSLLKAINDSNTEEELASYTFENINKKMAMHQLMNGMRLVLTAPESEIRASENHLIFLISVSTAFAVILSVLLSLFIVQGIVKPIEALNRVAGKIANGDLNVTVVCDSKDEIGALADSFQLTVERLKEYIQYIKEISEVLEKIADGNLVFELQHEYTGEFFSIKKALLNISYSLNHTLSEISHVSEQVSIGSEQVSSGAQELSQGATEQAASVEELSATLSELAQQVKTNAQNAQEAYILAKEAGVSVEGSNRDMEEMTTAIHRISETSEKINQIVKTVEDIASRTNILALNAAIESARAGEAGKGFTVVANEVRSLAAQVDQATKNISALVQNAISTISSGTLIVGKTEKSLKEVVDKSTLIECKLQEISKSSEWQASSIEQVDLGIEQISAVVQTNSSTAQEEATASQEMSNQAKFLQSLIKKFILESGE